MCFILIQMQQSGDIKTKELQNDLVKLTDRMEQMNNVLEDVQEKMYDFEANKKNNLIIYGIPNESRETTEMLATKVKDIMKTHMMIRREIPITKAGA